MRHSVKVTTGIPTGKTQRDVMGFFASLVAARTASLRGRCSMKEKTDKRTLRDIIECTVARPSRSMSTNFAFGNM